MSQKRIIGLPGSGAWALLARHLLSGRPVPSFLLPEFVGPLVFICKDQSDLEDIATHIIKENPKAIEDYKKGKLASLQFLVGQVMRETRGKANPKIVQEIIRRSI